MFVSSTAEEIKNLILGALLTVAVELKQLYAITTDNGANVVKSCKLLNDEANAEERESSALGAMICSSSDEESDWEATDIAKTSNTFNTAGNENTVVNVEIILDDAVASITQHQTCLEQCSDFNVASVKCAAHTLQLAVTDVLKRSQFSNTVDC